MCMAQSLPIIRMAICHRSHWIPSQLLWRRSKTMSDQKLFWVNFFWTILWAKYGTLFRAIVGLLFGFFGGFLEPDKTITFYSVCAAQSLPILRMAACHRSHRIPSQLLCRRSETMSDQTFRKKSWDGTLHCNDTVHTLDFFFFIKI